MMIVVRMMSEKEDKPRYNVHFRISTMPNGFMVLDYEATPEDGNIYDDEKHGYQMVIRDVSQSEARRVCHVLNNKEDKINELSQELQDYKDSVSNFLFENMHLFNKELINQINNELNIDLMDILALYVE